MVESVVIYCDKAPIDQNSAIEAIRLGSGFMGLGEDIDCKIVFTGEAVYLASKHSNPKAVGMDSYDEPLLMADLSDLEIYIDKSSLQASGLTEADLIDYENLNIVTFDEIVEIMNGVDTTFRF